MKRSLRIVLKTLKLTSAQVTAVVVTIVASVKYTQIFIAAPPIHEMPTIFQGSGQTSMCRQLI